MEGLGTPDPHSQLDSCSWWGIASQDGFLDPVGEFAEVGVDGWHAREAALGLSERNEALQGAVTDQGSPGISLFGERGDGRGWV